MTIQVTGVLVDPTNTPISKANIRITSLDTNSAVLAYAWADKQVGIDGSYDFNLLNGKFKIEIKQKKKYIAIAYVEVSDTTTTPITVDSLIDTYSYCEVEAPICVT